MSFWYKKMELARRFSIFYSASLLAGAFGGLLAGAILAGLNGAKGLPAWKWLFLSEWRGSYDTMYDQYAHD
jgi:MFS family permease